METEKNSKKSALIGFKIEPELQQAYRVLPLPVRKEITERMRATIKAAVNSMETNSDQEKLDRNKV